VGASQEGKLTGVVTRGGSLPQPSWCDRLQDTLTSWFKWL